MRLPRAFLLLTALTAGCVPTAKPQPTTAGVTPKPAVEETFLCGRMDWIGGEPICFIRIDEATARHRRHVRMTLRAGRVVRYERRNGSGGFDATSIGVAVVDIERRGPTSTTTRMRRSDGQQVLARVTEGDRRDRLDAFDRPVVRGDERWSRSSSAAIRAGAIAGSATSIRTVDQRSARSARSRCTSKPTPLASTTRTTSSTRTASRRSAPGAGIASTRRTTSTAATSGRPTSTSPTDPSPSGAATRPWSRAAIAGATSSTSATWAPTARPSCTARRARASTARTTSAGTSCARRSSTSMVTR